MTSNQHRPRMKVIGIEHRQIGRPDGHGQVLDVGDRRVGELQRQGRFCRRSSWSPPGSPGPPSSRRSPPPRVASSGSFSTTSSQSGRRAAVPSGHWPQRPIVQQQEHKRQRDEHRLAEQPRGHAQEDQSSSGRCWAGSHSGDRPASVSRKKSVESTSLRSAIQATDSTCSGCTANSAATAALGQRRPVIRRSATNSSTASAACKQRVHRVMPAGAAGRRAGNRASARAT